MKSLFLAILLLAATACLSQNQDKAPTPFYEKTVEWIDVHVPTYPPLALQARIRGTVSIEVRFIGCALDLKSPRVVSGHAMLVIAAMEGLRQSTLRCGDFPDSAATIYYEFDFQQPDCNTRHAQVEVSGNHMRIVAAVPCVQP